MTVTEAVREATRVVGMGQREEVRLGVYETDRVPQADTVREKYGVVAAGQREGVRLDVLDSERVAQPLVVREA